MASPEERLADLEDRVARLERSNHQLLDLVAFTGGSLAERAVRLREEAAAATS